MSEEIRHHLDGSTTTHNSEAYETGNAIGNALTTTAQGIQNAYSGYVDAQIAAAAMANSASAEAQRAQFNYNKELMNLQNLKQEEYLQRMFDFNTASAKQANEFTERMWEKAANYNTDIFNAQNAFNERMWQKSADYNTAEAKAQRSWQEKMSASAYQRAVKDMRAAGINPILAAHNGGANIGSGATASMGSTSSGSASMGSTSGAMAQSASANAAGGSVGNYGGQGYHLSDTMALMGSVIGVLGEALNGLQANNFFGNAANDIIDAGKSVTEGIRETFDEAYQEYKNWKDESNNSLANYFGYSYTGEGHQGGGGSHSF